MKRNIEITGSVFKRSPEEFKEILDICSDYGFAYGPSILKKDSKSLRESSNYVKKNYGDDFLTSLVVSKSKSYLEVVLPYLDSRGELDVVKNSASILSLKFDEIKAREAFIERIGEANIVDGRFNSIYGLSRKKFEARVKAYQDANGIKR